MVASKPCSWLGPIRLASDSVSDSAFRASGQTGETQGRAVGAGSVSDEERKRILDAAKAQHVDDATPHLLNHWPNNNPGPAMFEAWKHFVCSSGPRSSCRQTAPPRLAAKWRATGRPVTGAVCLSLFCVGPPGRMLDSQCRWRSPLPLRRRQAHQTSNRQPN